LGRCFRTSQKYWAYSSLNRVTTWLMVILAVEIIASLVILASDAYQIRLLNSIMNYEYDYSTAISLAQVNDMWQSIITEIELAVAIISIVVFLYWFYRAYRNLPALGATGLKFNPKWVIVYFFIPILALWKPFRALAEIWTVSGGEDNSSGTKTRYFLVPWWILFVVSNMMGFLIARGYSSEPTIETIINYSSQDIAFQILVIIADALFIFIAKEICARQDLKSRSIPTVQ
jgi:hypothetical protein